MDERASSPTAPARSPLPLTSYILKVEKDVESMESEEESNPLEQEDAQDSDEDSKLMEPQKEFIMTFESLQILWDPRNPFYTNKFKRRKALAKLVPILRKMKPGATIEDVKKKINSLRSNYRRHLRKAIISQQSEADPSDVYIPTIWYYPYLDFLRKLEERTSRENESVLENGKTQKRADSQISQVGTSLSSVKIPESSTTLTRPRKRTIQSEIVNTPKILSNSKSCSPCPCELCPPKNISNHVVLEWAEILEKLDPMQRLYAKKAINDVLFEAELGNLHKHSVKINEPSPNDPSTSFPAHSSIAPPTQTYSWQ